MKIGITKGRSLVATSIGADWKLERSDEVYGHSGIQLGR